MKIIIEPFLKIETIYYIEQIYSNSIFGINIKIIKILIFFHEDEIISLNKLKAELLLEITNEI